ncbi:uncharacterized protein DUF1833 [Rhodobacter aestuarii]|uniref:Uncharacterized protein n=1 Tax=Rhodobacter aestuarii TaxID=453582 RepID=A0A1N7Q145_9RHOB|nr:DUF1833 family protein [Rhodobacter aestuarii]PTV94014.1 uncharacterized protein DUF1833 [Rhodobacter aestuarii]SIT16562.1 protein of unknown function [Rhodobacter aestuarii]
MTQRILPTGTRQSLEATESVHTILAFVTIEHPNLIEPMRVVADCMDYLRDGYLWQGLLFGFTLPTDGDEAPSCRLTVPNVDRRIGMALRQLADRATVTLEICSSADFDLSLDPREPKGTVMPVIAPTKWDLVDIDCNVAELTGRLMIRDFSQEPFPSVFATQDRLPGLFR